MKPRKALKAPELLKPLTPTNEHGTAPIPAISAISAISAIPAIPATLGTAERTPQTPERSLS
ncbi:hypothetical protein [Streptomyces sp. NPDC000878]